MQSTVLLVQQLRDQLAAQLATEERTAGTAAQTGKQQPWPAQQAPTAAGALHNQPIAASPAGRRMKDSSCRSPPVASCTAASGRSAAARSSLFTPAAAGRAVADWHQAKVQQQEEAAVLQQRQLAREEQLLLQLAASEEAAYSAHEQVRRCGIWWCLASFAAY